MREFRCCQPSALAEKERRLISQCTRDTLGAKKAQSKQLPKLVAAATKRYRELRPTLLLLSQVRGI